MAVSGRHRQIRQRPKTQYQAEDAKEALGQPQGGVSLRPSDQSTRLAGIGGVYLVKFSPLWLKLEKATRPAAMVFPVTYT
jgi:hypothetical protein